MDNKLCFDISVDLREIFYIITNGVKLWYLCRSTIIQHGGWGYINQVLKGLLVEFQVNLKGTVGGI